MVPIREFKTGQAITPPMTFERSEKKYLLSARQAALLKEALSPHLQRDKWGWYTICSIYYDTHDFSLIRKAADKPIYKEKLRLRSYGVPTAEGPVYLELKKKLNGITYKRRMELPLRDAKVFLQAGIRPAEAGQVFNEIDWFVRHNRPEAKALISYDRIALHGREDAGLRVTLDTGVRWRTEDLDLALGDAGRLLLPHGSALMEVKTATAIPLWLAEALSAAKAYPVSFSKYGAVYEKISREELRKYA